MTNENKILHNWEILQRVTVYKGRVFDVEAKKARSPRTGKILNVHAIRCADWVMVLPLTQENEVVMVRQYRHGMESIFLELPGGIVDAKDPSPETAARRELLEETGYDAATFIEMGETFPQPAILDNKGIFYLARGVRRVRTEKWDAGEDMEIVRVPLSAIEDLIEKKEIRHGMVLLAFFFFQRIQR